METRSPHVTEAQEEYFRTVAELNPSPEMRRALERARLELGRRQAAVIVRGESRVRGISEPADG